VQVADVPRGLLLVDVIKDFLHEDGDKLLWSCLERQGAFVAAIRAAREAGVEIMARKAGPFTSPRSSRR
jgi:hypothetical protein